MRFKTFLKDQTNYSSIFESSFDKFYTKGYYGTIKREEIREQQKDWFDKFLLILEEGDISLMMSILSARDSICREWFSSIYQVEVKEYGKKEMLEELTNIFKEKK